ncbi:Tetratricopeptide repeat protein 4 [Porites harrisoni]
MERGPEASDVISNDRTLQFDDENLRAIAEVYKNEGNDEYNKGTFSNAIDYYTDGIKMNCKDKELNAKLHSNRAAAHLYLGNYTEALNDAKIAVSLQPSFLKAFGRGASACVQLNKFNEAIRWCDKGLAIDPNNDRLLELRNRAERDQKNMEDNQEEEKTCTKPTHAAGADISTRNRIDNLEDRLGDGKAHGNSESAHDSSRLDYLIKRRIEILKEDICNRSPEEREKAIYQNIPDYEKALEGLAYCSLGHTHQSLGDFKIAIDYHECHLKIAKELGDKMGEGVAYSHLGIAHLCLGDFKTAVYFHERHLKIAKELGDRTQEGNAYGNLGNAYRSLCDFKTAIDYHERHLKISKELGDRSGEGRAYAGLGSAHRSLGDFKTAIDYHERQLKIAKDLGDRSGEGVGYGNLGLDYQMVGDFKTAINYLNRRLKIAKEVGDRSGEGKAYCNLGCAHSRLEEFETAIPYFAHYLKIVKELGEKSGECSAYGNLGCTHCILGDFKTAIDYHKRQLKISKELGEREEEAKAYCGLGNAYCELRDLETAISYHESELKISKELGNTLGEGIACSNLGGDFEYKGQVSQAIGYYQRSITLLNKVRDRLQLNDDWKISLRDQYQTTYAALWRLFLADNKVTEALLSAEQGRAQGLKDLMAFSYGLQVNDPESGPENSTFQELSSRIPLNTIFMAFGKGELVFWVCQQGKEVQIRRRQISSQDEVSAFFASLVNIMGQKIGARDFVECEDRSLKLVSDARLAAKSSIRDGRKSHHIHLQKDALSTLYDIIIEPIQNLLVVGSELIFVPEGPLFLAPFAAFKGPNSKHLCESFRIRLIPSLTSLKMIGDCPVYHHCKSGVLLVGDPWVQEVVELEQLPFAKEEVEMIGEMLGCTPLIGRQATKDAVLRRLGSVALVHIAAHGSMETGEIALAPDDAKMDFILTMRDVLRVKMRARLVVLSCCHSAQGEIKAEGVVGIARAFLGAGARSVLVSLWAVDDKATLEFMKNFYQHLVKGKSAGEALNQAMSCMRESEEFGAVKYWAPFVLTGDDVTLEFALCE